MMRRARGLTLMELMVGVALVAFISLMVLAVVVTGNRAMSANQARISATQEARRGLDEMARELVRAPVAQITDEDGAQAWPPAGDWEGVQFRYPESVDANGAVDDWSPTITYTFDEDEGQLVRTDDDGETRVMANGVTSVAFRQGETADEMWIELTTERTSPVNDQVMEQPLGVRIRVRNE